MKQKTWIISALMCAMVIMVCLGVLHLLKEMTENNAPSGTVAEESTDHTEPEIDFAEEEETKEDIAETGSEEEESDVPVEREEGYYGWKQELPQIFPSVPEEVPYEPPRLILATDLHYQSAQADDGGAAFQRRQGGGISAGAFRSIYGSGHRGTSLGSGFKRRYHHEWGKDKP